MDDEPNAASVAIIEGDKVLLIKRAREPYAGLWTLPGGRREPGETLEACATREVREELGLVVGDFRSSTILQGPDSGSRWRLSVYLTMSFEGEIVPCDEIEDCRWVSRAELEKMTTTPGLAMVFDSLVRKVQEMQAQQ